MYLYPINSLFLTLTKLSLTQEYKWYNFYFVRPTNQPRVIYFQKLWSIPRSNDRSSKLLTSSKLLLVTLTQTRGGSLTLSSPDENTHIHTHNENTGTKRRSLCRFSEGWGRVKRSLMAFSQKFPTAATQHHLLQVRRRNQISSGAWLFPAIAIGR